MCSLFQEDKVMRNLKVRTKLFAGFLVVAAIGILLGSIGIISLLTVRSHSEDIVLLQNTGNGATAVLNAHYAWRHNLTEAVLSGGDFTGSVDPSTCALGKWLGGDEAAGITDNVILELLRQINAPHNFIHTESRAVTAYLQAGEIEEARERVLEVILPKTQEVISLLTQVEERLADLVDDGNAAILDLENTAIITLALFMAAAALCSVLLTFYISGMITKPLAPLNAFMAKAGTTGDIALSDIDREVIGKYAASNDEIGKTIQSCAAFVAHVTQIADELASVANGDLTADIHCLSSGDVLGVSLQKTVVSLNDMFGEIASSTAQVSVGSKQVADGAQSLAQGSTEQAAAVEELSSSISEIAGKTKDNAKMAEKAAALANAIKTKAEDGNRQMDEMTEAVKEINLASQNISKVIKVIDDIAFQTNILALNAAVEAARAGQHGKGFAVVAEEVRNLAAKSAEAARETGGLISDSMEKAELGARISGETAASLAEIVSGINESSQIVHEIAKSSEEQSAGIVQINQGIDQVAIVIQQNSATAEQSAAASEEMNGQSDMLQQLTARFKLRRGAAAIHGAGQRLSIGGGDYKY
jgi:methyl-accepting chemotaxis protein